MNLSTYRISLDIHDMSSQVSISVKRGDTCRRICAVLTENGKPYVIAEWCSAFFRAKKPMDSAGNRAIVYNDCTIENNTICYTLTAENTEIAGIADCEFSLYDGDKQLITSPHFTVVIDNTVNADNEVETVGHNEVTALTALISEATELCKDADAAKASADSAKDSEDAAKASEEKAEEYADSASDYANASLESAENSLNYANEAKCYAEEAASVDTKWRTDVANALVNRKSGACVRVDDVSPIEHPVSVKVNHNNPTTVTVTRCGKNLLPYPYISKENTVTSNGITFTDNGDGTITANGTATARTTYYFSRTNNRIYLTKGEQYMLSGCPSEGSSSTYVIQGTDSTLYPTDSGLGKTFTASGGGYYFYIIVYEGAVLNNVVFKPQLEVGGKKTPFEPYINPAIYTPNADGTVEGITSLSPSMTLLTDTEGAVIECEYNVDIKKYIDSIASAPSASSAAYISSVTLFASKWTAVEDDLYSQMVAINGVTENSKVDINPSMAQLAVFHKKDIAFVAENEDGVVTVYCIGQKPLDDYTMQVTITEVIPNG